MKSIIEFFKFAWTYTEAEEFESCSNLGSTNCNKCPKFKECVKHFNA